MPRISITRQLILPILNRARQHYDVWLNEDDQILSQNDLIERSFDSDGLLNRYDLDSDNDGCLDAFEAGYTDQDGNGILGEGETYSVVVDSRGRVIQNEDKTPVVDGYTLPDDLNNNGVYDFREVGNQAVITKHPEDIILGPCQDLEDIDLCLRLRKKNFEIIKEKKIHMSKEEAEQFYKVHESKPFYNDLCAYLSSGPIIVISLQRENAVAENRKLMGATNPQDADEGTLRKKYGISIDKNSVHGSDSLENAKIELDFFFNN